MAFHTPGGGEVQLKAYQQYLSYHGVTVTLFDQWDPKFYEFDLMHFFSCIGGSLHFCAFIKQIGMLLVTSPNLWITEATKHLYPYDEIRAQLVLSDHIVGNSDIECDVLASVFNIPRVKFSTVYNGVADEFFEPTSPDFFRNHFGIDRPFILNVANIEPRKNQLKLIQSLKAFPDLTLVIIGHERDPTYSQQCKAEGGGQLLYLGPLSHDSILLRSAYSACELFALPSTLETPGLAALEAAACGAKILITSEGSTKEYFGEGAVYVAPNNVDDISQGISKALRQNKSYLSSLIVRANFTWKNTTTSLANLYNGVCSSASSTPPSGFYSIERDGNKLLAWSRPNASFACSSGILRFLWRTVNGAFVDIRIDGSPVHMDVYVHADWHSYAIEIKPTPGQEIHEISIRVRDANKSQATSQRELGVALAEVNFASHA